MMRSARSRSVTRSVPTATLDIYGDGPERERLQRLIDELGLDAHVALRGLTDEPGPHVSEASVFLSTSAFEGQGLSIAEALVHGCPVVAYDVRYGPRELLAQGGGMLVPDADLDALAAALIDAAHRYRTACPARPPRRSPRRARCIPTTRWPRSLRP